MAHAFKLNNLWKDFVSLLFPKVCIHCGNPLVYQEQHLCVGCRSDLPKTGYHLQKDNPLEQKFVYEPKVKGAASYLHFHKRGLAQSIIHEIKYGLQQDLATLIGFWYGEDLKETNWNPNMIIPIPLHKSKLAKRGFNQSELIANGIAKALGIPVESGLVVRHKRTMTQTKKSKIERLQNVESIYKVLNTSAFDGQSVLIVDDVLTTGATAGEMASVLAQNTRVSSIYIVSIAAGR